MEETKYCPLFVDLDGTYTKADLLFENLISAFKQNPLILFFCFFWLTKGKAHLKAKLALYTEVDTKLLPLNPEFVAYLEQEKQKGRKLFLATAACEKYAQKITKENTLFDGYISSCENINLAGENKLKKIKEISEDFAYAGNDAIDFEIFKEAKESLLVNPSFTARKKAKQFSVTKIFDNTDINFKAWLKQLRLHQWLKNLLIFVPLMVSGAFAIPHNAIIAFCAFFAFSLLASATYILNDLLDLTADRLHPRKKNRPLAAGTISIKDGILVGSILFSISAAISFTLGMEFTAVLLAYLCLTLFYSFTLKQYIGMDVVALALLYTIRILAGAAAIGVLASFWLIAFSIFVFLSLALVKRCSEIQSMGMEGKQKAKGRDYCVNDYSILSSFGSASAMLAVLMFCFYINSAVLTNQYQQPNALWLIVPALCYWLMRMWIKTHRGEMHDDPIVFSLRDKGSLITIGLCGIISISAQTL